MTKLIIHSVPIAREPVRDLKEFCKKLDTKRYGGYNNTWHARFGLHSGIPKCCIRAFMANEGQVGKFSYMRCNTCIRLEKVTRIHWCNDHCKPLNSLPKGVK